MKINKEVRNYRVIKMSFEDEDKDYGFLPYEDVVKMLKGYKYDEDMEMYFSSKANFAYDITEA